MRRVLKALCYVLVVIAVAVGGIIWSNHTFEETFYTMESYKIDEPIRAVLLADLHQKNFGSGNRKLLQRIEALEPDVILVAGDVVNKNNPDWDYAADLCRDLVEIAPVYYGMGNHENEALYGSDLNKEFLDPYAGTLGDPPEDFTPLLKDTRAWQELEATGVQLLQNEAVMAEINGNSVKIGGLGTNSSSFWPYSGQFVTRFIEDDPEAFKLLIAHRPEPVAKYISDAAIDLTVSGHNHGGVIRIPGAGGLVSEEEGLFPTYDGGWYSLDSMALLVSRGLGGHGLIPRVFNQPELVIVDIN